MYSGLKLLLGLPFWSKQDWEGLWRTMDFDKHECAYREIQATKPHSLGYGMNDSPVGLLAWLLEKYQCWRRWWS